MKSATGSLDIHDENDDMDENFSFSSLLKTASSRTVVEANEIGSIYSANAPFDFNDT